jgi:hypothetical protein
MRSGRTTREPPVHASRRVQSESVSEAPDGRGVESHIPPSRDPHAGGDRRAASGVVDAVTSSRLPRLHTCHDNRVLSSAALGLFDIRAQVDCTYGPAAQGFRE